MTTPVALTIAGSDSAGGAGLQADLKTFAALRVHGASAVTVVTAQNTLGVEAVHPVPPEMVARQIEAVLADLAVGAVKTGLLGSAGTVGAVATAFEGRALPLVVDPVLVSRTGQPIVDADTIEAVRRRLIPLAAILTPNLDEAALLTGTPAATTPDEMAAQGEALIALGARLVLVKAGRGTAAQATDILVGRDRPPARLAAPRVATRNVHGTGCTLSAAIAAHIALGFDAAGAATLAKLYVTAAIEAADRIVIGRGHGPVHHFHRLWREPDTAADAGPTVGIRREDA